MDNTSSHRLYERESNRIMPVRIIAWGLFFPVTKKKQSRAHGEAAHMHCNSTFFSIFDMSPLIGFKPMSSNRAGTQPGRSWTQLCDFFFLFFKCAGSRWGRAIENFPRLAGGVASGMPICSMCLITHQGAEMILAQTWHILQCTVYVYHNQAEKSKWPVQQAERASALVWEDGC